MQVSSMGGADPKGQAGVRCTIGSDRLLQCMYGSGQHLPLPSPNCFISGRGGFYENHTSKLLLKAYGMW